MEDEEEGGVTARPAAGDTFRPGDGGVSLEDYAALVVSTRPPPSVPFGEMTEAQLAAWALDELVGSILDEHERALLEALDVDSSWPDP